MTIQVFINQAVKDLEKSKAFFAHLGYSFNAQFSNEKAACMIISDTIYAMLLTEPFFASFTDKTIIDAKTSVETLICLSCSSRAQVDELVQKALGAGGSVPRPVQDHGFMYAHSFEDLDGHIWELVYMEPSHIQAQE